MPRLFPPEWKVLEVDHKAVVGVYRGIVHLFPADIRKYALAIPWIFRDQAMHLSERRGDTFLVRVVESEAHAKYIAANKALVFISDQNLGIFTASDMEQIRRDAIHEAAIQEVRPAERALVHVDHADHHGSLPWPLVALACPVDHTAVAADPAEPC